MYIRIYACTVQVAMYVYVHVIYIYIYTVYILYIYVYIRHRNSCDAPLLQYFSHNDCSVQCVNGTPHREVAVYSNGQCGTEGGVHSAMASLPSLPSPQVK